MTTEPTHLPLEELLVLDFGQFLAAPSAALRLADLGARVIKVERPGAGEQSRSLGLAGMMLDGDSLLFHTINRNKESLAADLRDADSLARVKRLVERADVLIESFRPGVMSRLGLDYESVRALNDRLVYASVTGYGPAGPWRGRPGQDLLVQALSGLTWLSGNADDPPVAFGLSVVDTLAGEHLCQGILACLVRRGVTGRGGRVEVSLLESAVDLQFEVLTAYLNDPEMLPRRSAIGGAHPYVAAPYGIYAAADGFVALAMAPVPQLADALGLEELRELRDPAAWFARRDEIKRSVAEAVAQRGRAELVAHLEASGLWAAEVRSWPELVDHEAFRVLDAVVDVGRGERRFRTTRCPIRIDGRVLEHATAAPRVGQHDPLPGEAEPRP